jgi:glycine cleavage system regulatory protein
MDQPALVEALAALGLERGATWSEVRAAFRARILVAHPDRGGTDAAAARLNAAFALLQTSYGADLGAATLTAPDWPAPLDEVEVAAIDDDSLHLVAPADEVFARLLAALDSLGTITYVDEAAAYFEAVLGPPGGACRLVVDLQGRGGATEAWFSLDALGPHAAPALATVVRDIAARVRRPA